MDQARTIISGLQALHRFSVVFTRFRETLNGAFGDVVLDSILKVDEFLSVREIRPVVYRDTELLPEAFPIQDVSVESRYFQFWELGARCRRLRRGSSSSNSGSSEAFLDRQGALEYSSFDSILGFDKGITSFQLNVE